MTKIVTGTGNVFADLGLKNPAELQVRADLMHQIYKIIKQKKLTQLEASKILGIKQPDVSAIMNGKFVNFSIDRLLHLLVLLNREIEIVVKPVPKRKSQIGIHVYGM